MYTLSLLMFTLVECGFMVLMSISIFYILIETYKRVLQLGSKVQNNKRDDVSIKNNLN